MKISFAVWAAALAGMLIVGGCTATETAYQSSPAPTSYAVPAPPAVQAETIPASPGPNYVWVGGYWDWTGTQYSWVPGYWAVPPAGKTEWVPPRYDKRGDTFMYHRGYWRGSSDMDSRTPSTETPSRTDSNGIPLDRFHNND